MLARVPIDRIKDNPFQSRRDYTEIDALGMSILAMALVKADTSGLLQVPPARIVLLSADGADHVVLNPAKYGGVESCLGDEPTAVVQLAAGHRRHRAFYWLAVDKRHAEYQTMPVDVQVLNDEAMADVAREENERRQDLSPIERARAISREIELLGWTQEKAGERWGLTQAAVSNKLRLLNLPADVQEAIHRGEISERHGRALLSVQGKSPALYADVAAEVLPVAIAPETAEKARDLAGGRGLYLESDAARKRDDACDVCGHPIPSRGYRSYAYSDGQALLLCEPCYRAATDWHPPSVRELDDIIEVAERRQSRFLGQAQFPLDVQVDEGDDRIHHARCTECPYRYQDGDREKCGDQRCFMAKTENWRGYQQIRLVEALHARYGDVQIRFHEGYAGYDLKAYDDVDAALVCDGVCAPGKCKRLRMRYYAHTSESYLYPVPGLPFIYNCDNANSHAACQRRYLASQQSEEDLQAEKQVQEAERARQRRAYEQRDLAAVAIARALLAGEAYPKVWGALALKLNAGVPDEGQAVRESARRIGVQLLSEVGSYVGDWGHEAAGERYERHLAEKMKQLGVGMPLSLDGLRDKLERIRGFLLDGGGLLSPDLTDAQLRGNDDNLRELLATAADLVGDGLITQTDYGLFADQVEELREALQASRQVSRDVSAGNGHLWAPQPKNAYLAHHWTWMPDTGKWYSNCGQAGDEGWAPVEDQDLKRCLTCERLLAKED